MTMSRSLSRLVQLAAAAGVAAIAATAPLAPAAADDWHHHWRNAGDWRGHDRGSFSLYLGPGYVPYPYDTPPPAYYAPPRVYYAPPPPVPYYAPAYPRPSVGFSVHVN